VILEITDSVVYLAVTKNADGRNWARLALLPQDATVCSVAMEYPVNAFLLPSLLDLLALFLMETGVVALEANAYKDKTFSYLLL